MVPYYVGVESPSLPCVSMFSPPRTSAKNLLWYSHSKLETTKPYVSSYVCTLGYDEVRGQPPIYVATTSIMDVKPATEGSTLVLCSFTYVKFNTCLVWTLAMSFLHDEYRTWWYTPYNTITHVHRHQCFMDVCYSTYIISESYPSKHTRIYTYNPGCELWVLSLYQSTCSLACC